jgi:alpha-1,3-rhamnosyl/mannosyltransferase
MVPGNVGGSETYTTRLLAGLSEQSSDLNYTLFALPQFATAHPEIASRFEVLFAPLTGQWRSFRVAGENSWLAAQCKAKHIELVHYAGGIIPALRARRPVLTIHDLQYLFYPEYFTKTKRIYLSTMVPRSAEAARLVLTPSEFTRRTVIERLNIDPSIVHVVPHGIRPYEEGGRTKEVLKRFGIEGRFFLYPAATYPHKNHLMLIEALSKVVGVHPNVSLVLTGARASVEEKMAREMGARIVKEIEQRGLQDHVHNLGYIAARDLDALYREAVALTFPSHFEGFGAPVLEAMSRGCPVISADTTALPEVVDGGGLLVSPDNADEWTQSMLEMLEEESVRERLGKVGRARALEFSWTRSAEMLVEAYHHALATPL